MTERIVERIQSSDIHKPSPLIRKEKIIRCKDCKHVELKDFVRGTCKYRVGEVLPDGFCEKGEQK